MTRKAKLRVQREPSWDKELEITREFRWTLFRHPKRAHAYNPTLSALIGLEFETCVLSAWQEVELSPCDLSVLVLGRTNATGKRQGSRDAS